MSVSMKWNFKKTASLLILQQGKIECVIVLLQYNWDVVMSYFQIQFFYENDRLFCSVFIMSYNQSLDFCQNAAIFRNFLKNILNIMVLCTPGFKIQKGRKALFTKRLVQRQRGMMSNFWFSWNLCRILWTFT